MPDKMPSVSGKKLLDYYLKQGSELKRIKGSHHVIKSSFNQKIFVIPIHKNEDLDRGTLHAILTQSGVDIEYFLKTYK